MNINIEKKLINTDAQMCADVDYEQLNRKEKRMFEVLEMRSIGEKRNE